MSKIRNPIRFSQCFGVSIEDLATLGALNPTLNVDTKLFIDPFLLKQSKHKAISIGAYSTYRKHFEQVIRLLSVSRAVGDVPWRNARRLMEFPEVKGTCLGYGAQSVSGSGSGAFTTDGVMNTAKAIVELGVDDPDLFVAMGLFEDGIGPDRISDMTTNVIFPDLLTFNKVILARLGVPTEHFSIALKNGESYEANLPVNPCEVRTKTPIILVPEDILRDLPIATDWSDVAGAAAKNTALRHRVNRQVAEIWRHKTLKDKRELRAWAMSSAKSFDLYLELIRGVQPKPYSSKDDPLGELTWRRIAETIAKERPFQLRNPPTANAEGVAAVVNQIIEQFRFLVEDRRLSEELYHAGKPRPEKAAQRLFFAVAHAYCKANNIDLTPEADTGNGPVDFKMSIGFSGRVLVEIKLSTNSKILSGYSKQLEAYKKAEEALIGYYVVIDVGGMGRKDRQLLATKNAAVKSHQKVAEIIFIDGKRRVSASKL